MVTIKGLAMDVGKSQSKFNIICNTGTNSAVLDFFFFKQNETIETEKKTEKKGLILL